jgi:hypothetical protein
MHDPSAPLALAPSTTYALQLAVLPATRTARQLVVVVVGAAQ